MQEGDLAVSLLWFVEALKLVSDDAEAEKVHRYRIETIRRQCPNLLGLGMHGGPVNSAEFSPDGHRFVVTTQVESETGMG